MCWLRGPVLVRNALMADWIGADRVRQAPGVAMSGRVAPARCLARAPTDPDVQISRIRLFGRRIRYVAYRCTMRGGGSEKRFSSESIAVQLWAALWLRRDSHLRQMFRTSSRSRESAA